MSDETKGTAPYGRCILCGKEFRICENRFKRPEDAGWVCEKCWDAVTNAEVTPLIDEAKLVAEAVFLPDSGRMRHQPSVARYVIGKLKPTIEHLQRHDEKMRLAMKVWRAHAERAETLLAAADIARENEVMQVVDAVYSALSEAANHVCECGGADPGDPKACGPCLVAHEFKKRFAFKTKFVDRTAGKAPSPETKAAVETWEAYNRQGVERGDDVLRLEAARALFSALDRLAAKYKTGGRS